MNQRQGRRSIEIFKPESAKSSRPISSRRGVYASKATPGPVFNMNLSTRQPSRVNNRPKTAQKSRVGRDYENLSPNIEKKEYSNYINYTVA
jgi:hypothetical protein